MTNQVVYPALFVSLSADLHRQMHRLGVAYHEPVNHPQKTVDAMRLLAAITDNSLRASVSHALYKVRCTCITYCIVDIFCGRTFRQY